MPLHVSSTMCSSSGAQNCIIQHLVSSHCRWPSGAQVHGTATYSVMISDAVYYIGMGI